MKFLRVLQFSILVSILIIIPLFIYSNISSFMGTYFNSWNYETEMGYRSAEIQLKMEQERTVQVAAEQDGITERTNLKYDTWRYVINSIPILLVLIFLGGAFMLLVKDNSQVIMKLIVMKYFGSGYNPNQISSDEYAIQLFGYDKWNNLKSQANKNGDKLISKPTNVGHEYFIVDAETSKEVKLIEG